MWFLFLIAGVVAAQDPGEYSLTYKITDNKTGATKSHSETRKGNNFSGKYSVEGSDGSSSHVSYGVGDQLNHKILASEKNIRPSSTRRPFRQTQYISPKEVNSQLWGNEIHHDDSGEEYTLEIPITPKPIYRNVPKEKYVIVPRYNYADRLRNYANIDVPRHPDDDEGNSWSSTRITERAYKDESGSQGGSTDFIKKIISASSFGSQNPPPPRIEKARSIYSPPTATVVIKKHMTYSTSAKSSSPTLIPQKQSTERARQLLLKQLTSKYGEYPDESIPEHPSTSSSRPSSTIISSRANAYGKYNR